MAWLNIVEKKVKGEQVAGDSIQVSFEFRNVEDMQK